MNRAAVAALLAFSLVACSKGGDDKPKPPTIQGVDFYEDLAHDHVKTPVTYPQTPPVGGPHSPAWLNCGVYDQPVPNVNAVHSMEHGAIWVTYRPGLPDGDLTTLKRLHGLTPAYVLISPYEGLPTVIVASTWGYQLKTDRADDPRLAEFVKEYAGGNQGGEGGARCSGGLSPEQAELFNASPGASTTAR